MRFLWLLLLASALVGAEPVRLHPDNPHYLQFRGKPLLIVSSGEHYGAVLNRDFDFRKYLAAIERDGMNYTRLFPGSYVEPPGAFGIQRNTLGPAPDRFVSPWAHAGGRFDLEKWDPEYFARLKDFLRSAGDHGVIVEMTLFSSTYGDPQWAVNPFNPANNGNATDVTDFRLLHTLENGKAAVYEERLVRKLVSELNGFDNLIFEIQNEPWADQQVLADEINPYIPNMRKWPNAVELANGKSLAWQAHIAGLIQGEEAKLPNKHLIAQNYSNFRSSVKGIAPGVSILNFHYAYPEAAWWNFGEGKMVACDETGFMGSADTPYRQEAWRFLLAGGGSFNNLDYSFTPGKEDGTDSEPNGPGGGSPALRSQLKVMAEFIRSFDFIHMRPDQYSVLRSPGLRSSALSNPGIAYAIYLAGDGPSDVELGVPPFEYRVEWLDPKTGANRGSRSIRVQDGPLKLRTPDFRGEIALRIVRTGK
jgi:hypothetical protein